MIEVGMKDQKLRDPCLIDMKCSRFGSEIRDKVTQPSADQHGPPCPPEVNTRLFRTEKP